MFAQPADYEPNTPADIEQVVLGVKATTSLVSFTVVVFASYAQMIPFSEMLAKHCNLGVDTRFVHWRGKQPSVNMASSTSTVEIVIVGRVGEEMLPHMQAWEEGLRYMHADDHCDVRHNMMFCDVVKQHYRTLNGQVTPQSKKICMLHSVFWVSN